MKVQILAMLTGHGVLLPAATFVFCGLLVFAFASQLARHADAIADNTGLGRLWVGSLVLAASTSMPEMVADTNAAIFGFPNIGVGDLFGSTLSNMLILAMLMMAYQPQQLLRQAALDHALVGTLAIVLTATAGLSIAGGGVVGIAGVGLDTVGIAVIYVIGMRIVFEISRRPAAAPRDESPGTPGKQLRHALAGFGIATLGLLVVAPALVFSADALAVEIGVSDTFVGTFLVGMTTSVPELAAAVAAVRLGAVDLAVGNILGSNAFNMSILLLIDAVYRGKPLLAVVSGDHAISSGAAVIAVALGVMAILARTHERTWVVRFIASMIMAAFALSVFLLARSQG